MFYWNQIKIKHNLDLSEKPMLISWLNRNSLISVYYKNSQKLRIYEFSENKLDFKQQVNNIYIDYLLWAPANAEGRTQLGDYAVFVNGCEVSVYSLSSNTLFKIWDIQPDSPTSISWSMDGKSILFSKQPFRTIFSSKIIHLF